MEPWIWVMFGVGMWFLFARGGAWSCSGSRRSRRTREASGEVARLKAELATSTAQIEALKRRLEAVETIVTDEEAALRREFDSLSRA